MVHSGRRNNTLLCTDNKLYIVRNELPGEAYLLQVPLSVHSLRSRTSFILVDVSDKALIVWHGAKSPSHTVQRAKEMAAVIKTRYGSDSLMC